jgi:hypothetical protein
MLDVIQHYHLGFQIDVAQFIQDSCWIVASYSPPSDSHASCLTRGQTRCFALVMHYRNRRTFFLVRWWFGESLLKGTRRGYLH